MPWLLLDSCQFHLHKHKLPCYRIRVPAGKSWDSSTNHQPSPVTGLPNWLKPRADGWAGRTRSGTPGCWASLNTERWKQMFTPVQCIVTVNGITVLIAYGYPISRSCFIAYLQISSHCSPIPKETGLCGKAVLERKIQNQDWPLSRPCDQKILIPTPRVSLSSSVIMHACHVLCVT